MSQLHIIPLVRFNNRHHDRQLYVFSAAILFSWLKRANLSGRDLPHPIPLGKAEGCHICPFGWVFYYLWGDNSLCRVRRPRLPV